MAKTRKKMRGGTSGDTEDVTNEVRQATKEALVVINDIKTVGTDVINGATIATNFVKEETKELVGEAAELGGEAIDGIRTGLKEIVSQPSVHNMTERAASIGTVLIPDGPKSKEFIDKLGRITGYAVDAFPTEKIGALVQNIGNVVGNTAGKVIATVGTGVISSAPGGPAVVAALNGANLIADGVDKFIPIAKRGGELAATTYNDVTAKMQEFADNTGNIIPDVPTPKIPEFSINKNMVGGAKRKISQYRRERRRITRRLNKHIKQFNATRRRS
jgi:hypothetical protein